MPSKAKLEPEAVADTVRYQGSGQREPGRAESNVPFPAALTSKQCSYTESATWRRVAEDEFDFLYCASGPMVRSSYKAGELFVEAVLREGKSVEQAREDARAAD